jgi:flagellin
LAVLAALQAQTRGITQQISNGMSEISMLQTAEGALDSTSQSLQRMSELSVQAANGTLTDSDRSAIMAEIKELSAGIDKTLRAQSLTAKTLTAIFRLH